MFKIKGTRKIPKSVIKVSCFKGAALLWENSWLFFQRLILRFISRVMFHTRIIKSLAVWYIHY